MKNLFVTHWKRTSFIIFAVFVVSGIISISLTGRWGGIGNANFLVYTSDKGFYALTDLLNFDESLQFVLLGFWKWAFIGIVGLVLLTRRDYAWKLLGCIFLLGPVVAIVIQILILFSKS